MHYQGVWSTVCDSVWYESEAKVLCRSLGCGSEVDWPRGLPHSLAGRMYYSCEGDELTLSNCFWRFNNSNLCSQSLAARVICSGIPSFPSPSTTRFSPQVSSLPTDGLATGRCWPKKNHCPYHAQADIINGSEWFFVFVSARCSTEMQMHALRIYQGGRCYVLSNWSLLTGMVQ